MEPYNIDKQIEKALTREPDFHLSTDFADRLVYLIEAARQKERKWELTGIIVAGVLFIIALSVTLYLTEFKFGFGALIFLNDHIGLVMFGLVFIILLNFLDKKFIKKTQAG